MLALLKMPDHSQPLRIATLALAAVAAVGCSDNGLRQVTGVITVAGEPLTMGRIEFIPESGRRAVGHIQEDGAYQLTTFEPGDGAKPGEYKVLIEAIEIEGQEKIGKSIFDEVGPTPGAIKRRSLINPKYSSRGSTPLTASVENGSNQINFELEQ